mgnify:CR=1 FL=1
MPGKKQNLTLVVDEDLLLAARKAALDRRTSVNQLVRDFLASLAQEPLRRHLARVRLEAALEKGLVEVGPRTWTRDELYDR